MLRKINWFTVMGPMLITAMVLSACGPGAATQSSDTPVAPQAPAASTETPAATDQSMATPAATDQSMATPAATDQSVATPAATDQSMATPAATDQSMATPAATDQSMATPAATDQSMATPAATDQSMATPPATDQSMATPLATEASPMTTPEATGTPSASGGALAAPGAAVQVANDAKLGSILTDGTGMTLYVFKNDTPGVSNCNGTCAQSWLPLTVAAGQQPAAGTGVSGTLGVITRSDGTSQVTYNDMPLYRFQGDKQPGDTTGQGMANGLWSVVTLTAAAPAAPAAATPQPTEAQPMETPSPQATSSY